MPQTHPGNLPTPIKPAPLTNLLRYYFDKEFVLEGLSNGFSLGFVGPQSQVFSHNSPTVSDFPHIAKDKVDSEIRLGRIAGPFNSPPFNDFKCSPLALREKSTPGKFRLLHNLSYPYNQDSVNLNIPNDKAKVSYSSIEDAISFIVDSPGCFLAKSDIAEAYRLLPLHPSCYNLTGFSLEGKFFFDKCLPMGARSACQIFERFSNALIYILNHHFSITKVVKVLDDFLFIGDNELECSHALNTFIALCDVLGIPLAEGKTVPPTQCLSFLGILLDSKNMLASIPQDKILRYAASLAEACQSGHLTLRDLQSLIGKLNFVCYIIPAGRCFLRRLHDATRGPSVPGRKIVLSPEMLEDLGLWNKFLHQFNAKRILARRESFSSQDLNICTDSSKLGFGGTFQNRFIIGTFPPAWQLLDIQVLEFYPVLCLVAIHAPFLRGKSVYIRSDNSSVVAALNSLTSRNKNLMCLLRYLVCICLSNDIIIRASHVPGSLNTICDALSRQQIPAAALRNCGIDPSPLHIPAWLRPQNLRIQQAQSSLPPIPLTQSSPTVGGASTCARS